MPRPTASDRSDPRATRRPLGDDRRWPALKQDLITWALKFDRFRETLLADPKTVVEQELGERLPDELTIDVSCESEARSVLVIPPHPVEANRSIADAGSTDLDQAVRRITQSLDAAQPGADPSTDPNARLIARAWRDPAFKQRLLTDSKATVAEALGVELADDHEIVVVEETSRALHLVLPMALDETLASDGGLRDEDLASLRTPMVAGSANNFGSFKAC